MKSLHWDCKSKCSFVKALNVHTSCSCRWGLPWYYLGLVGCSFSESHLLIEWVLRGLSLFPHGLFLCHTLHVEFVSIEERLHCVGHVHISAELVLKWLLRNVCPSKSHQCSEVRSLIVLVYERKIFNCTNFHLYYQGGSGKIWSRCRRDKKHFRKLT